MKFIILLIVKVIILLFVLILSGALYADVILHKDIAIGQRVDVAGIFLLNNDFWDDGLPIIVYVLPLNSVGHRFFVRDHLDMSTKEYKRAIASRPQHRLRVVKNMDEMVFKVSTIKGAVGYVDDYEFIPTGTVCLLRDHVKRNHTHKYIDIHKIYPNWDGTTVDNIK